MKELTQKEKESIDALVAATRALPKTICIRVEEDGLHIQKRIEPGLAKEVAMVRKASLKF